MVWHFIGVYLINNSRVENISRARAANEWNIFQHLKRNFVSPRGQEISSMYSYGCMVCERVCELLTHWKSQQNRSGKVAIIQKLNWQEDHWHERKGSTFRWKRQSWAKTLKKLCNNSLAFISPLCFSQVSEKSQLNTVEGRVVIQGFLTRRAVPDVEGRL